jgi:hypothetical protein
LKKLIRFGVPALLAFFSSSVPLGAAVLQGTGSVGASAPVAPGKAAVLQGGGSVGGSAVATPGSAAATPVSAVATPVSAVATPGNAPAQTELSGSAGATPVDPQSGAVVYQNGVRVEGNVSVPPSSIQNLRSDARLHGEYRGYSGRLRKVDEGIARAEKDGRYTAEEARQRRAEVQKVRASLRKLSDKGGPKLSVAQRAKFEAEVKAREDTANEAGAK